VIAQARKNHRSDFAIQHVISDVVVDVDGDRADVRANLVVSFAEVVPVVAPPVTYALGEVYRFVVVRTGDGWRLAEVETVPVWMSGQRPVT